MHSTLKQPYPRLRTQGSMAPQRYQEVLSGAASGNGVVGSGATPPMGLIRVMSDIVTPGFKKLSSEGNVIFNSMQKVEQSCSSSEQGWICKQIKPGAGFGALYTGSGNCLSHLIANGTRRNVQPFYDSSGAFTPSLTTRSIGSQLGRAIAVASTKAQTIPSDASLLVALAEYRKTLELVPGLLNGWRKLFARVNAREASFSKKRTASRNQDAARNLRDLADTMLDTWNAMRFGVRPLVMDTIGVVKAIQRARASSETVRTTKRGAADFSTNDSNVGTVSLGVGVTPILTQSSIVSTVRAMSLWEARISVLDDLGVNLAHVPEAVIDLTRFSFVLNWVVNLNDFALALGSAAQPGWSNKGGCYVLTVESSTLFTTNGPTVSENPDYAFTQSIQGHILAVTRETSRVVGLPPPSLVLRPDALKWTTDFRLLDAIALLRQQTRGKGVRFLATLS